MLTIGTSSWVTTYTGASVWSAIQMSYSTSLMCSSCCTSGSIASAGVPTTRRSPRTRPSSCMRAQEAQVVSLTKTVAPRGATVFVNDTTWASWARMQEEGRVRGDLRVVGTPAEAMLPLVQHELHMSEVEYDIWIADHTDAPVYVVTHDDVPIVSIY